VLRRERAQPKTIVKKIANRQGIRDAGTSCRLTCVGNNCAALKKKVTTLAETMVAYEAKFGSFAFGRDQFTNRV
jgi:hypothetical protein